VFGHVRWWLSRHSRLTTADEANERSDGRSSLSVRYSFDGKLNAIYDIDDEPLREEKKKEERRRREGRGEGGRRYEKKQMKGREEKRERERD
jgi:hypothetical protein